MTRTLDLLVIGTGTAGTTVARKCRRAGWSVAVVDYRLYGGTCALRGCDPKKVLVGAAEAVDAVRRLSGKGVRAEDLGIDWRALMSFKRSFTDPFPARSESGLAEAGIETLHGAARFVGPTSLEVNGERIGARRVHIAAGAKPVPLPIPGSDLLTTSEAFLELHELPRRIVFVGSGYVSFELAHVAATAGAQVTMLEMGPRPLAGFDADLVSLLVERTRRMGVDLRVNTTVTAVSRAGDNLSVEAVVGEQRISIDADLVVHGAGRVPDLDDLNLPEARVEFDAKRGVLVNEYMQSVSNAAVYAAGDAAAGGLPLTPVAAFEAHIAAANLLRGNQRKAEYPPVPSVVFTLPPLATVGLTEGEARARGDRVRVEHARTSSWYASRRVAEEFTAYKVLIDEATDRIVGAHLIGPGADEVINLFAMAMRAGLTSRDIKTSLLAYPTAGSDIVYMV